MERSDEINHYWRHLKWESVPPFTVQTVWIKLRLVTERSWIGWPFCLSACLSVDRSVCLSICLFVCLFSVRPYICLSVCPSVNLSVYLPVCVCLSVCLSVCVFVYLSVCLSACRSNVLSIDRSNPYSSHAWSLPLNLSVQFFSFSAWWMRNRVSL